MTPSNQSKTISVLTFHYKNVHTIFDVSDYLTKFVSLKSFIVQSRNRTTMLAIKYLKLLDL